jgi:phage terminase large subunit-like protein
MGIRGPGARPVKLVKPAISKPRRHASWKRKGLSRSQRVIRFVESLTVTAGDDAGKQFRLREWQKEILRRVYDPKADDGRRLARTALLTVGRKNGKSGLVAALALAHLCGPEAEQRGQVYSAAADRSQASILYREMKAMALASPELATRIIIKDFNKEITDTVTGSIYVALSADAHNKHGFSASFVAYDELAQAPDRRLFDVLETSTGARKEPLVWIISTQSSDPKHIMSELTDYARDVNAGVVEDPTFAGFIFEVPQEANIWDENSWRLANPALGDFRSLDEMRGYAAKAKRLPAREAVFRNLYLNQRIDALAGYISGTDWQACADQIDITNLAGQRCFAGLDLSSTRDLTAFVLWFPDSGAVLPYFWIPGADLDERERNDRGVPYRLWRDQGLIEAPAGRAVDKRAVVRRIAEIVAPYDLIAVAYDRWRIEEFKKTCDEEGISLPLKEWGQGFKDMAPALDALEDAVIDRKLHHGGNPVLTWNVSNAVVDIDPTGARKLNKRRARARIDGLQALAMALGIGAREPVPVELDFDRPLVLSA